MGKARMASRGSNNTAIESWQSADSWESVQAGDDLLVGAEEGGFMGLEVLKPNRKGTVPGSNQQVAADGDLEADGKQAAASKAAAAEAGQDTLELKPKVKGGKKRKAQDSLTDVDKLQAQMAQLKRVNAQLKASLQQSVAGEAGTAPKAKRQKKAEVAKAAPAPAQSEQVPAVAGADISSWKHLQLAPQIEAAIAQLGFSMPTPIQEEALLPAIRDRRDIIGAAQTGSGKTLAFGLPIMQLLMAERQPGVARRGPKDLKALVLAPTRELALQVCDHLQKIGKSCGIWVVPIVGGISMAKQERLLRKQPEVVVATPGRLWELMRGGHAHLTALGGLRFLVLDEADRMVQKGHFQELGSILEQVPKHGAEPAAAGEAVSGGAAAEEGLQAEAVETEQAEGVPVRGFRKEFIQTFVFSATLTLPSSLRERLRKGGGGSSGSATLDSLMDQLPFRAKPKVVDLTSTRKLADKVVEAYVSCSEEEQDSILYYLLAQHPGRTLVFVNAISSVRRLAALLRLLQVPALALHASMQQRQRLKALDRFKGDPHAVMVATDVAARGLDIQVRGMPASVTVLDINSAAGRPGPPNGHMLCLSRVPEGQMDAQDVRCVIHYQLPASADVYVHRSGRTARGQAEGISIALVGPKEQTRFQALWQALERDAPPEFPVDTSLMPAADKTRFTQVNFAEMMQHMGLQVHSRVKLAVKIDEVQHSQSKQKAEMSWKRRNAEQLGVELSDDSEAASDDEGQQRRKRRAQPTDSTAAAALQQDLGALLSEPLAPKFSHRFFTGGGGSAALAAHKAKEDTAETSCAPTNQGPTVQHALALAQKLQASRDHSEQQASALKAKKGSRDVQKQPIASGKVKSRTQKPQSRQQIQQAALEVALRKKLDRKTGGRKGPGLVVIPAAFGRDQSGPDALQALRATWQKCRTT